jgi:hypothetical protein
MQLKNGRFAALGTIGCCARIYAIASFAENARFITAIIFQGSPAIGTILIFFVRHFAAADARIKYFFLAHHSINPIYAVWV